MPLLGRFLCHKNKQLQKEKFTWFLLDIIKDVDNDKEQDYQERHSARNYLKYGLNENFISLRPTFGSIRKLIHETNTNSIQGT